MGMIKEFREFAIKGNVIDMAVGIVIGAAFTGIVTSLVNDVVMPPIGKLTSGVDFSNKFVVLGEGQFASIEDAKKAGVATLNYGKFINAIINFTIVAFCVFLVVKQINRLKAAPPPADPTNKKCTYCVSDIPIAATRCPNCTSQL